MYLSCLSLLLFAAKIVIPFVIVRVVKSKEKYHLGAAIAIIYIEMLYLFIFNIFAFIWKKMSVNLLALRVPESIKLIIIDSLDQTPTFKYLKKFLFRLPAMVTKIWMPNVVRHDLLLQVVVICEIFFMSLMLFFLRIVIMRFVALSA